MQTTAMTKTLILGSIVLMFLGTSLLATAYHIAEETGTGPGENPATQWVKAATGLVVICESEGENDKQNPQPQKLRGVNGLCYASSDHATEKGRLNETGDKKKEPPRYDSQNIFDANKTKWSRITPICDNLQPNDNPNGTFPMVPAPGCDPDLAILGWFAQLGVGGYSCAGAWEHSYYYPEFLAWTYGSVAGSNFGQGTGHVTFFVEDGLTAGSYDFKNDITWNDLNDALDDPEASFSASGITFCGPTHWDENHPKKQD